MDTLIRGGTVVTCDAENRVLEGDVLVRDGAIAAIGAAARPRGAGLTRVVDARGCAVIPGLVQAHVHLCQALMRGMADDLPLLEWLKERIWPLEAAHDETSLAASAELGLAEMMLGGTTTILDMGTVHAHDAVLDACVRCGHPRDLGQGDDGPRRRRARGPARVDAREPRRERAPRGDVAGRRRRPPRLRVRAALHPVVHRGARPRRGRSARPSTGTLVHTHAAEHPAEREAVRNALGDDDVAVLRGWGVAGPRAILAHGVQLDDDEARAIAGDGTRVVHCPSANLKLGSGIARIAELDVAGVQLALGADGAPCNNNLDAWTELRHAALLAKIRSGVTTLPASRALPPRDHRRRARPRPRRARSAPSRSASAPTSRSSDSTARTSSPAGDVFSRLVYACRAHDVRHVFVDGALVVKDGEHQRLDVERVKAAARAQAKKLAGRAGV